jgi:hypothetical protein
MRVVNEHYEVPSTCVTASVIHKYISSPSHANLSTFQNEEEEEEEAEAGGGGEGDRQELLAGAKWGEANFGASVHVPLQVKLKTIDENFKQQENNEPADVLVFPLFALV